MRKGGTLIEVATFRGVSSEDEDRPHDQGRILSDNVFGTVEEDALRRDFTINALFLDPVSGEIRDYVGGYRDLADRCLRLIGDPVLRYREDPVRLLRAARFVAKLGVEPDPGTGGPIAEFAHLLERVPPARLFEEVCKLFMTGHGLRSMEALQRFGLSATLFPGLSPGAGPGKVLLTGMLRNTLENTDDRVRQSMPVTPAFLFAALLWEPLERAAKALMEEGESEFAATMSASEDVLSTQARRTAIPRRFSAVTRQIWVLQARFGKTGGRRWKRVLFEERFRAGYDFLLLRALDDASLQPLCEFWTEAQDQVEIPPTPPSQSKGRRDRPRRRYRRRRPARAG